MPPTAMRPPQGADLPEMTRIIETRPEAREVVTLRLERDMSFEPGQFILVWIPGLDEKPYAVSRQGRGWIEVTLSFRGPFSRRLGRMRPGESVGLRGPYGKGFTPKPPVILVAGGCGVAPLAPLKDALPESVFIAGAQTSEDLIFRARYPDMVICTDDGSAGHKGFPTELLQARLERREARTVCACGPEPMLRAVFDLCEKYGVECQAGLERYMKCGIGVCGQCACDAMLVCRDGPVFNSKALRAMDEFGRVARLKSGQRVTVQEYGRWRSG